MENFASLIRVSEGNRILFVSFKSAILSESQFRFVILEGSRYTHTHTHIHTHVLRLAKVEEGGVKRDFRDGKIFFHDTYPSPWEADTQNRRVSEFACAKGWRARKIATVFHWVSVFIDEGGRNIGIGSSSPFRAALLAKSVVGPIYDDKGGGRGGKEKKKREERGRRKVGRTETNGEEELVAR